MTSPAAQPSAAGRAEQRFNEAGHSPVTVGHYALLRTWTDPALPIRLIERQRGLRQALPERARVADLRSVPLRDPVSIGRPESAIRRGEASHRVTLRRRRQARWRDVSHHDLVRGLGEQLIGSL